MDTYQQYLYGRGLAQNTIRNYLYHIDRAGEYATRNGYDLANLKPSEARDLAEAWPRSAASRRQLRVALQHYWRWLHVDGPIDSIRVPKRPVPAFRGIPEDQTRRLLNLARTDWPRGGSVYIGIYLGIRRQDIASLKWTDFHSDFTWVRFHEAKNDRYRELPVHPRLKEALTPHVWPGDWVFPARLSYGHVATTTLNNWASQICQEAGIGHVTPHQFRHTCGGRVYEETGDINLAMEWLGHMDISTTRIYTKVGNKQLMAGMASLNWEDNDLQAA